MSELPVTPVDQAARTYATDPGHHVVLEASAGTGKTRVLVDRYLALLAAGVDPRHVLAITFTRKAAAEMRERILTDLKARHPGVWQSLRDRADEIAVSTIDAFCFSLLREFPLEAGLDPGFTLVDETEVARLVEMSLDRTLRECRARAPHDDGVRLVLAQMTLPRLAEGLRALLQRRFVAPAALRRYLGRQVRQVRTEATAAASARRDLRLGLESLAGGVAAWIDSGPPTPLWDLCRLDFTRLVAPDERESMTPLEVRAALDGVTRWVLTLQGEPRKRPVPPKAAFASPAAYERHRDGLAVVAAAVHSARRGFDLSLNVLLARGIRRVFRLAHRHYLQTLVLHDALDFSEVLARAVLLLGQMDEFSRSRFRLESRFQHVLVDEFQDTSRLQWQLVASLVQAWGEGAGVGFEGPLPPSLFLVGDRKQSIYRFRDADVGLLDEAVAFVQELAGQPRIRQAISQSFRSHPDLLAFANDLGAAMVEHAAPPAIAFRYGADDRFPLPPDHVSGAARLGLVVAEDIETCAASVATEILRLLADGLVTDRGGDAPRRVRPGDVAILFRSRESHREFERALAAQAIPSYVYKGLGFYDADEIKDLVALVRVLAAPESDLRAAAFLRSRLVGLSDDALRALAPSLAARLTTADPVAEQAFTADDGEALRRLRAVWPTWLALVDRLPPADVVDHIVDASAYAWLLRGDRERQARENVKKFRSLLRRIQNRGYATMARIAAHVDRVSTGDESNAAVDAADAVTLMTVHASKGLEFPIVFLVNLTRGTGGVPPPLRVVAGDTAEEPIVGIARYEPGATEAEQVRDREESKRLMYVAVTRARERLYLSAAAQARSGRVTAGAGSLASVCPPALLTAFNQALAGPGEVTWEGGDQLHHLRVCPPASAGPVAATAPPAVPVTASVPPGLQPLATRAAITRGRVTDLVVAPRSGRAASDEGPMLDADLVVGRAVHRLLARGGGVDSDAALRARVLADLAPDERLVIADTEELARDVVAIVRHVWEDATLRDVMASPATRYEVPIVFRQDDAEGVRLFRGSIDCLAPDGNGWQVLEFKTGRAHSSHDRQLALYVDAVRAMTGGPVCGRLVYAMRSALSPRRTAPVATRLPFDDD